MSESQHLSDAAAGLFQYSDHGWFTPFIEAIQGLTAAQAACVPQEGFNSIWSVVNHVTFWQEVILLNLQGQEADFLFQETSKKHGWPAVTDAEDEAAWQAARERVARVNTELANAIAALNPEKLDAPVTLGRAAAWQGIHGVVAHNSYHTCEVISLRHMQGLWLERV